jgi:hypothetical protein
MYVPRWAGNLVGWWAVVDVPLVPEVPDVPQPQRTDLPAISDSVYETSLARRLQHLVLLLYLLPGLIVHCVGPRYPEKPQHTSTLYTQYNRGPAHRSVVNLTHTSFVLL